MKIKIEEITLQNFKGCKQATYIFDGDNIIISGANGSGKTTIFDAFTWLLFGKDSLDNAKFEVRPLDNNGNQINNVEICVYAILNIDGKEVELKKTQKQNWVKKRGSENPILQGNVNSFEIDGYPRSEKVYKEYINGIVNDDLFKMLTNPTYFPYMPWKDQRATIMKFASNISDTELVKQDSRFIELISEIEKAPSTDDIKNKYQKSLTELKKKQIELPVRIDEISKSKTDIDVAELELQKNVIKEQIAENKAKQDDISKQFEEYQRLSDEIMKLKFAKNDIERKANEGNIKKRREIEDKISDKKFLLRQTEKTINDCDSQIDISKYNLVILNESIESYRSKYKDTQSLEFDENSLICSYCGQEYPQGRKEQIKAEFNRNKDAEIKKITELGIKAKAKLDKEKETIKSHEKELVEHRKSLEMLNNAISDFEKQLSEIPESIDITNTDEYKKLQKQIDEKEEKLSHMNNFDEHKKALDYELECLQKQLIECEKQIAMSIRNVEIDERIAELQTEQRATAQKIADVEKMLYLLDEFIKYKLDKISDSINSQFELVNFVLFRTQINGGIAETCECQYQGIPYSSLNSAAKIQCGLDIIRSLQKMYDTYVPVFIDNRESCTNIPAMDCQVISLYVSPSDKELRIEVK